MNVSFFVVVFRVLSFTLGVASTKTIRYVLNEESDVGTKVGDLAKDLDIFQSKTNRKSFRFIDQPHINLFNLRAADGQLSVAQRLDREQLCRRSQYCELSLDVVAVHQEKYLLMHVEVDIRDINDNAPKFPVHEMYLEILESASEGTRFPLEVATDEDVGRNYIQTYTISMNEHFIVEVRSVEEGGLYAELVLVKELDREKEDTYSLDITAVDGGIPPLSGILTVKIKVLDINDNTPAFEDSFIKIVLSEDARVGLFLLHLRASDPDEGQNGEVVYGFEENTPLEIKQIFNIDPHMGRLTLAREVDYENREFYELKIIAYDMGVNSAPAQCTVRVDILDVNDNAPVIIIKPQDSDSVTHITESAPVNSCVAFVSTMDRDSGVNGHAHCSLLGHEHFRLQHAYGYTFMIITTSLLDRETFPEYNLTAIATDQGTPPLKTILPFSIQLSDVNDNPPEFTKSLYEVWIEENNLPGVCLTIVQAYDSDVGQNAEITYSVLNIQSNSQILSSNLVSIDPLLGSLYTAMSFNYEQTKDVEVQVLASDGGFPILSKTAMVWVRVVDMNDNAPVIMQPKSINGSAFSYIGLQATTGTPVLQIIAEDADEGLNAQLSFDISEDPNKLFLIDKTSGCIYLKTALNYTVNNSDRELKLTVRVSDHGIPSLQSTVDIHFIVKSHTGPTRESMLTSVEHLERFLTVLEKYSVPLGLCVILVGVSVVATVLAKLMRRRGSYSTNTNMERRALSKEEDMSEAYSNNYAPFFVGRRDTKSHENEFCSSLLSVLWGDAEAKVSVHTELNIHMNIFI
ncbi:protocadherin-8-like [Clupea harengus]|uniref:Protocadherin-8-like n=1 Tax=Clupea harengus TaxID=7950 RepID=A0A6P8GF66_CLUHA|nr:protocadherin-8-like [Clupea harengus]